MFINVNVYFVGEKNGNFVVKLQILEDEDLV